MILAQTLTAAAVLLASQTEPSTVLSAECLFSEECTFAGTQCKSSDQNLTLAVKGYRTRLMETKSRKTIDYGFETHSTNASMTFNGRFIQGAFAYEDTVLWYAHLSEKPIGFQAQNSNYEFWRLEILPDGQARMKESEGQEEKLKNMLNGHCEIRIPEQKGEA